MRKQRHGPAYLYYGDEAHAGSEWSGGGVWRSVRWVDGDLAFAWR